MRKFTNILRGAFAVACCLCGMSVFAQKDFQSVVATGGDTNAAICCTVGETFVGANMGMWCEAVPITSGIHNVYDDGDVVVENLNDVNSLKIQLSEQLLAQGVSYSIYNISGIVLDSNVINESPYVLKYESLLKGQYIIIAIQSGNNVIATYKIIK